MRAAGIVFVVSIAAIPVSLLLSALASPQHSAQAQTIQPKDPAIRVAEAKGKAKGKAPQKKNPPGPSVVGAYANMPVAERALIQFDLAWTGHYNGLINGEFSDRLIAAVKAYQKDRQLKDTGVLAPADRAALAASSKARQERVGWRMVDDKATGAQVGLPTTQVPNTSPGKSGTRWSSAQGQVQVETFRIREPGTKLATIFEQQKKEPPNRKLEVNLIRDDFFILSGMQGLKKFYVRASIKDFEVRGITILWDQATEGIMDPVVVVMSSAFAPFRGTGLAALLGAPARRSVDYGTGIVVSAAGHILADRQVTEGCSVLQVAGYGDVNRIADDEAAGLTLLRVFGAPALVPAGVVHAGARGADLTLVGIADPQSQGGGRAVSTAAAKLNGDSIQPPPQLGFAGAAALDGQGRFFGMVALKTPVVASTGTAPPPQANLVPVETIRKFLDAQYVTPTTGQPGIDAAKAAIVRVICVRR